MSKKIISPIGSLLLGKKKKKAAEPVAAPTPTRGPKVTPLGSAGLPLTRRSTGSTFFGLSDRLGG